VLEMTLVLGLLQALVLKQLVLAQLMELALQQ
jgi:hypothetical protein